MAFRKIEPLHTEASVHSDCKSSLLLSLYANFNTSNLSNKTFLTKGKPNLYFLKKSLAKGYMTTIILLEISNKTRKYFTYTSS